MEEAKGGVRIGFPLWVDSWESIRIPRMECRLENAFQIGIELARSGMALDIQCVGREQNPNRKKIERLCREWHGVILEPHPGENRIGEDHPFACMRDRMVIIGTLQDTLYNSVCPDFYTAGQIAMEELIACGARRILYTGPREPYNSHLFVRMAGAEKVLESHPEVELIYSEDGSSTEKAYSVVTQFFRKGGKCDAIVANSAYGAPGCLRALADLGIAVPEEVQLIALGQIAISRYLVPRPTAVVDDGGLAQAVAVVMENLQRSNPCPQPNILLPVHLVRGETTRRLTPLSPSTKKLAKVSR